MLGRNNLDHVDSRGHGSDGHASNALVRGTTCPVPHEQPQKSSLLAKEQRLGGLLFWTGRNARKAQLSGPIRNGPHLFPTHVAQLAVSIPPSPRGARSEMSSHHILATTQWTKSSTRHCNGFSTLPPFSLGGCDSYGITTAPHFACHHNSPAFTL